MATNWYLVPGPVSNAVSSLQSRRDVRFFLIKATFYKSKSFNLFAFKNSISFDNIYSEVMFYALPFSLETSHVWWGSGNKNPSILYNNVLCIYAYTHWVQVFLREHECLNLQVWYGYTWDYVNTVVCAGICWCFCVLTLKPRLDFLIAAERPWRYNLNSRVFFCYRNSYTTKYFRFTSALLSVLSYQILIGRGPE